MKFNKALLLTLSVLFMLILAACGGGGDDNGNSNDNDSDSTTEASSSGGGNPTPAGVSAGGTVTYTDDIGTLSVTYPQGWVGSDEGGISIANAQAALDAEVPGDGQVRGTVDFLPDDSPQLSELGLSRTSFPGNVITATVNALNEAGATYDIGVPTQFINAGKIGARASGTVTIDGTVYSAMVVAYDSGNGTGRMYLIAPEGQIEQYATIVTEIAGNIEFEPGAGSADAGGDATEAAAGDDATEEANDDSGSDATEEATEEAEATEAGS